MHPLGSSCSPLRFPKLQPLVQAPLWPELAAPAQGLKHPLRGHVAADQMRMLVAALCCEWSHVDRHLPDLWA